MKDTVRHLQRKLQQNTTDFPYDLLQPSHVSTKFAGHVGFPEQADSLAYDPVQSLLAVGTLDGRVKLIGQAGVEVSLRSTSRSATKYLGFLENKGGILRVTQEGDIQLFSIIERKLLTSTWLQGDCINAVAVLPHEPYIFLGCESGNVRVVALLDSSGAPAEGTTQAVDLSLQPYQVLAEDLAAHGPLVSLDLTQLQGRHLLLLLHQHSGALVWDIRAEKILCAAFDTENEVSQPTACCWVGDRANCFAVGYNDGSILLFGIPTAALQGDPLQVSVPEDAKLLTTFRVAPLGERAAPVKSLSFVSGSRGDDWLLVLGGQAAEEPDMLTQLPLAAKAVGRTIPWFGNIKGHALVPAKGSLSAADSPGAVMVLTEGGQLVVHDLQSWQPMPLTLPFQELPSISAAAVVPTVRLDLLEGVGGESALASPCSTHGAPRHADHGQRDPSRPAPVQHALTLPALRAASRLAKRGGGGGAAAAHAWPLHGGEPAAATCLASAPGAARGEGGEGAVPAGRHPSALYFTGHRDGRVRVWDASASVPSLLLSVPGGMQERLRAVTALQVCPFSGVVMAGHQGGDVRVYQFSDSQQTVHRMNVDETPLPYDNVAAQPPGFQYVLRYSIHSADITALCLSTKLKLAAVADSSGVVSLLDLMQPALLWTTAAMACPVRHMAVGCHAVPSARGGAGDKGHPTPDQPAAPDTERLVLFVSGEDSSLLMLSLEKGEVLDRPLKPKNASRPLSMALLDANGAPVPPALGQMTIPWANNNTASAPAALAVELESSLAALTQDQGLPASPSPRLPPIRAHSAQGQEHTPPLVSPLRVASEDAPGSSICDSLEMRELPSDDDDVDEYLAAAAAAVADPKQRKPKFKLPRGFLKPGGGAAAAASGAKKDTSPGDAPPPGVHSPASPLSSAAVSPRPPSSAAPSAVTSPQQSLHAELPHPSALRGSRASSGSGRGGGEGLGGEGYLPAGQPLGGKEAEGGAPGYPPATLPASARKATQQPPPVDYPYLTDSEPQPVCYVLLCTEEYLRVYSAESVRLGDRTTLKKAYADPPLLYAGVFHSVHGPGVATLSSDGALAVYTVPGLDCVYRLRMDHSNVLGFPWAWGGNPAAAAATAALSPDGQLFLVGAANEIARVLVVKDCAEPAPPASTFDVALAEAATAALRAGAAAAAARAAATSYVVREAAPPEMGSVEEGGGNLAGAASVAEQQRRGLGKFFNTVRGTATGVLDTAGKAAHSVVQEIDKGVKSWGTSAAGFGRGAAGHPSGRQLPSLAALFATPVAPLGADDDIDYMSDDEPLASPSPSESAKSPRDLPSSPPPGASSGSGTSRASSGVLLTKAAIGGLLRRGASEKDKDREGGKEVGGQDPGVGPTAWKKERGELLQGGKGGGGRPAGIGGMRTASAVREAYGRPRHSDRSQQAKAIMEQNRQMLQQRGERLQDLEQRTAQMQDDASDFASLAKELESSFANRKWWQM